MTLERKDPSQWNVDVSLDPPSPGGRCVITADQGNILVAMRDTAAILDPNWPHTALTALVTRARFCFEIARTAPIGPMLDGPAGVHVFPWEYKSVVDALDILRRGMRERDIRQLRILEYAGGSVIYEATLQSVGRELAQLLPELCAAVGRDAAKEWPDPRAKPPL